MKEFKSDTNIAAVANSKGSARCHCGEAFKYVAMTKDGRKLHYWCPQCDRVPKV